MAGESQFTIGARASCTDGHCGEVRRLIIDPATETVTHLVIQPGLRHGPARHHRAAVPWTMAGTAGPLVRSGSLRFAPAVQDAGRERAVELVAGRERGDAQVDWAGLRARLPARARD